MNAVDRRYLEFTCSLLLLESPDHLVVRRSVRGDLFSVLPDAQGRRRDRSVLADGPAANGGQSGGAR